MTPTCVHNSTLFIFQHFDMISTRLKELGSHFGSLPVHNGKWIIFQTCFIVVLYIWLKAIKILPHSGICRKMQLYLFDCFLVLLAKNQTRFCHRVVNINNFFNLLLTFWIWTHVGTCAEHYTIFLLLNSNSNMGCESLSRYLAHLVKGDVRFCHHLAYIFGL